MRTCSVCHTENPDSADFCTNCGRPLSPTDNTKWIPSYKVLPWRKAHRFTIWIFMLTAAIVWIFFGLAEFGVLPYCGKDYHILLTVWACISLVLLLIIELILLAANKGSWKWLYIANSIAMLNFYISHFLGYAVTGWEEYHYDYRSSFEPPVMLYIVVGIIMTIYFVVKLKTLRKEQADFINNYSLIEDTYDAEKIVNSKGKIGVYNTKAMKVIIPATYDSIQRINDCFYKVFKEGKAGLFNREIQRLILPPEYNHIEIFPNGTIKAHKGSQSSTISYDGTIIN